MHTVKLHRFARNFPRGEFYHWLVGIANAIPRDYFDAEDVPADKRPPLGPKRGLTDVNHHIITRREEIPDALLGVVRSSSAPW